MGDRYDLAFRTRRLIGPHGQSEGTVGVRDGLIAAIEPFDADPDTAELVELAEDEVLLPGMVDTHVHVNDPGRAEWEGFATATRAAAEGGITTLIDMPLNSLPPTVDPTALETKRASARGKVSIDVGFWGGAIPGNLAELPRLLDSGVYGFKCFLLHSGVDEFPPLDQDELESALGLLGEHDAMMIVHAEDAETIDRAPAPVGATYGGFLDSRPASAETVAISRVLELARRLGTRVHILHLSAAEALPVIASARADGVRVTVESCPHYLMFAADEIPDGATWFKACPPIRDAENRELLWQGLADGVIDCVVSDHSPCTGELKTADFGTAWGGVAGLQVGLSALWTQARARGHDLADVVRWMSTRPAEIAGVTGKGALAPGYAADLCVFAPEESWVVDAERLRHRNPVSAYHGHRVTGTVRSTWLRGQRVGETPMGRLLSAHS